MVNIDTEELLHVPSEAAKVFPGRPNSSTIWRWHKCGIKGIRLETIVVGGRRYTSREAIGRFIERTTRAADGSHAHQAATPARRKREIERAERELDAAGI